MSRPFARRNDTPRLSAEQAARQGRVSQLAIRSFPDSPSAIAFLNGHDDDLGGRPIDLAVASDEGLAAVTSVLTARG